LYCIAPFALAACATASSTKTSVPVEQRSFAFDLSKAAVEPTAPPADKCNRTVYLSIDLPERAEGEIREVPRSHMQLPIILNRVSVAGVGARLRPLLQDGLSRVCAKVEIGAPPPGAAPGSFVNMTVSFDKVGIDIETVETDSNVYQAAMSATKTESGTNQPTRSASVATDTAVASGFATGPQTYARVAVGVFEMTARLTYDNGPEGESAHTMMTAAGRSGYTPPDLPDAEGMLRTATRDSLQRVLEFLAEQAKRDFAPPPDPFGESSPFPGTPTELQ
jgi:hypothetical protein